MAASVRFQEFAEFFSSVRTLLVGLPALVPFVNFTGIIGPLWPPPLGTSVIFSMFNIILLIVTFLALGGRAQKVLVWWQWRVGIPTFLAAAAVYFFVLFFHTYNAPDFEHREVGGLSYTKKALDYLEIKPGTAPRELIADMGNNADDVWTAGSLQFMRLVVLISWGLMLLGLEFVVTTFALIEFKKKARKS